MKGNCQVKGVVYKANVSTEDNGERVYIGLTDNTFKTRYTNHMKSFRNERYKNDTELSKFVWNLRNKGQDFDISWSIIDKALSYSNMNKRCNLCISEKLHIINADKSTLLNKRSELVSKCRHQNKYYLSNFNTTYK